MSSLRSNPTTLFYCGCGLSTAPPPGQRANIIPWNVGSIRCCPYICLSVCPSIRPSVSVFIKFFELRICNIHFDFNPCHQNDLFWGESGYSSSYPFLSIFIQVVKLFHFPGLFWMEFGYIHPKYIIAIYQFSITMLKEMSVNCQQ